MYKRQTLSDPLFETAVNTFLELDSFFAQLRLLNRGISFQDDNEIAARVFCIITDLVPLKEQTTDCQSAGRTLCLNMTRTGRSDLYTDASTTERCQESRRESVAPAGSSALASYRPRTTRGLRTPSPSASVSAFCSARLTKLASQWPLRLLVAPGEQP